MEHAPSVRIGVWTDHEKGLLQRFQLTVTDQGGTAVQLIIGVLFGLTAPLLSDFLYRIKDWVRFGWQRPRKTEGVRQPLLHGPRLEPAPPYPRDATLPSRKATRGAISLFIAFAIWAIVFIGWALAGGFATMLPKNLSGLSGSKICGPYSLKHDATPIERVADDMLQGEKEIRAGEYGRDCYGSQSVVGLDRCTFFNHQSVPYTVQLDQPCPFANISYCWGTYKAVHFTTGKVDASIIGVHSRRQPKFRRNTTCVPLNMDAGFMDGPYWNGDQLQVDYYLGPMNRTDDYTDYTFRQYGEPFKWGVTAYSVNVYQSTPYPDIDSWEPLPDIKREDGTYLSVLFIASCRIMYTGPSDDYIFPATWLYNNGPYYYNSEPKSRPLACIDSSEVCSSDGNCSRIDQEHQLQEPEYEFMRAALRRSTTYQSIQSRLGNALKATEKIRDTISYELDNNQWRVESEALFRTSLARIQHDALDIAVGFGREYPSYGNDSLDWVKSNTLCGLYKFNLPKGYTNINILAFLGLLALMAFVAFLCVQTDVKFDKKKEEWFQGHMMVFELVLWAVWCCLTLDFQPIKSAWRKRKHPDTPPNSAAPPSSPPPPPPPPPQQQAHTPPQSTSPGLPPSSTPPQSTLPPATQPASGLPSH